MSRGEKRSRVPKSGIPPGGGKGWRDSLKWNTPGRECEDICGFDYYTTTRGGTRKPH